jgi:hypothetical protein
MARNGSGTYSLPAGNPVVTGTTISSTWANNTLSDIAAALTASVANDGQTPILANQNWGGFDITNVDLLDANTVQGDVGDFDDITMSQNFTATGSGKRFMADFSNATIANRFMFQTTTANGSTILGLIPNGTDTTSAFNLFNSSSNPGNAGRVSYGNNSTNGFLNNGHTGSGTTLPFLFVTDATTALTWAADGTWTFATGVTFGATVALGGSATATTPALTDADTSVATTAYFKNQMPPVVAAFNYRRSTNQTSGTTILFATAVFTEYPSAGANYNTATGTFTAPATGIYAFDAQVVVSNTTGAPQNFVCSLIGNGTTFSTDANQVASGAPGTCNLSGIYPLTAGQTVIVSTSSPGLGGSFQVTSGYFSGRLVALT